MPAASNLTHHTRERRNPVPSWIWIVTMAGGVAGAALAKPGNVVGNLLPSVATFAGAALVVALIAWRTQIAVTRRSGKR